VIKLKRVYDPPSDADGFRILVDRLWPRGIRKDQARLDLWLKDAAPSNELRKWYAHDPEKWPEFKKRYFAELGEKKYLLKDIEQAAGKGGNITLIYQSREERYNNAVALKEYIEKRLKA
jgi:uncharacterized protein YeaO (DUF488 family)